MKTTHTASSLREYFLRAARDTMREPRGCLRHPYLVPGGTYAEQLWDWDSFWLTKGLLALTKENDQDFRETVVAHGLGSWKNFFENQADNGAVPILATPENGDVFGCTVDEGVEKNQAKPVLAQMAWDLIQATDSHEWIRPYFPKLLRFFERWTSRYGSPCGLLVWGSDVAIGVDNDPTTYGRPEFSSANLLLNCFFYNDLQAAIEIAKRLDCLDEAGKLQAQADALKQAVLKECWDEVDGFFYTVDVQCHDLRDKYIPAAIPKGMDMSWSSVPIKIKMFTGFLPMWCGMATQEQAAILVEKHLRNPAEFSAAWGIPALARNEKMYAPEVQSGNPSNWLGPVWIVADFMVYEGLRRYGFTADAQSLADKTIRLLTEDLAQTGTIHEYYHPETGTPNFNGGFLNWNVLAGLMTS